MSAARRLIEEASDLGVRLSLKGDDIKASPRALVTDELITKLRSLKTEIIGELKAARKPIAFPLTSLDERRAAVNDMLDQMQAENERRREWWRAPVEGWRESALTICSAATGDTVRLVPARRPCNGSD